METDKIILDACCGGRLMWFDKTHPQALYIDIRETKKGVGNSGHHRVNYAFQVKPDMIADFRDLPLKDKQFKLIAWDPPHLDNLQETSIFAIKYGNLNAETWRYDLGKGFDELWRVLDDNGVLIFKWSEDRIKLKEVLKCFPEKPLFGHTTGSKAKTHWMTFMKIPKKGI